jgi:hypothetical protein
VAGQQLRTRLLFHLPPPVMSLLMLRYRTHLSPGPVKGLAWCVRWWACVAATCRVDSGAAQEMNVATAACLVYSRQRVFPWLFTLSLEIGFQ